MTFLLSLVCLIAQQRVGATCVATSGNVVAVGGHGGTDFIVDGKSEPLGGEKRIVMALAFAGDKLIEAGGRAAEQGEIRCWDWKTRKLLWKAEEHRDIICSVAVAGEFVYTGGADKTIAVLSLATGTTKTYMTGHAGAVLALGVSPDGKTLASGGIDRSIRVWQLKDYSLLRSIDNHSDTVHCLAWSPDGKYLASGSADRSVRVWQPLIGRLVRIVRGHDATITAIAFTEKHIISGATDGRVRWIDAGSDKIERTVDAHADWVTGVAASGGGIVSVDWSGRIQAN